MTDNVAQRFALLADMGCIVCNLHLGCFSPSEIHHLDGKTKPGAHTKTIPLCARHHRIPCNDGKYVARHQHKKEFESLYGSERYLLFRVNCFLDDMGEKINEI